MKVTQPFIIFDSFPYECFSLQGIETMPIRSMTGFGLAKVIAPSGTYSVEIRGVNNRFLEIQIRLPKFAANLEARIKKEIYICYLSGLCNRTYKL